MIDLIAESRVVIWREDGDGDGKEGRNSHEIFLSPRCRDEV